MYLRGARIVKLAAAVFGSLVAIALVAGCGSDNGGSSDRVQEIPDVLTAFSEAFANNDVGALRNFWSETCSPEDIALDEASSYVLRQIFGGDYQVSIGPDLALEVNRDHVKVPLDQPEGAVSATVTVNGQEAPVLADPLPFKSPLELVLEDGAWKVQNCGGLFTEEE
jgi:hypothetical protein